MNRSNRYVKLSLLSVTVLLFGMFVFPNVYSETVSFTTSISPITILSDEFIPLLDTSTTGNLTSISVTANLPCDSSNNPLVTIVAGILGDTTNVIDSSSDFIGNGPRDTCVFRDNITNVTAANIPAINSIFLNHTGSYPVHIPQGIMVTLSGVFVNQTAESITSSVTYFENGFSTNSGHATTDSSKMDYGTNELDWNADRDDTHNAQTIDLHHADWLNGNDLSSSFTATMKFDIDTYTEGGDTLLYIGFSDKNTGQNNLQDFWGLGIRGILTTDKTFGDASKNGAVLSSTSGDSSWLSIGTGTYYLKIIRDGDTGSVTLDNDSDFSSPIATDNISISDVTGLRYFLISSHYSNSVNGAMTGTIDDLKIWDG